MNILFLSAHSVLERDELELFSELKYHWLSLGAYYDPNGPVDDRRPALSAEYNLFDKYKGDWKNRESLSSEQIKDFDIILVMHHPISTQPILTKNWDVLKHKICIYRSIGQSTKTTEEALSKCKGLKIVRYSPKEKNIPGFAGEDAMIRFYKDPEEFKDWNGEKKRVITIGQNFMGRRNAMNFDAFRRATEPFDRRLFGPDNEGLGIPGGYLSFEQLKQELRDNRAFMFMGTQPASYTLSLIEAMMTGIPVVALGKGFMTQFPEQDTYEIPDIITNDINGYVGDSIEELRKYIQMLLDDYELAKRIGEAGRKTAIELFSKEKIKNEWKNYLGGLYGHQRTKPNNTKVA